MVLSCWRLSLQQALEEKGVLLLEPLEPHPAIDYLGGRTADDSGLEGLLLDCLIDIAC